MPRLVGAVGIMIIDSASNCLQGPFPKRGISGENMQRTQTSKPPALWRGQVVHPSWEPRMQTRFVFHRNLQPHCTVTAASGASPQEGVFFLVPSVVGKLKGMLL